MKEIEMTNQHDPVVIPFKQLKHGAIYQLKSHEDETFIEARCNICPRGEEVWFTDKNGKYHSGSPVKLIGNSDSTFINHDCLPEADDDCID